MAGMLPSQPGLWGTTADMGLGEGKRPNNSVHPEYGTQNNLGLKMWSWKSKPTTITSKRALRETGEKSTLISLMKHLLYLFPA